MGRLARKGANKSAKALLAFAVACAFSAPVFATDPPPPSPDPIALGESPSSSPAPLSLMEAYRFGAGTGIGSSSYRLRLDPTLFPLAASVGHPASGGDCPPIPGMTFHHSLYRDTYAALTMLAYPGTVLTAEEIAPIVRPSPSSEALPPRASALGSTAFITMPGAAPQPLTGDITIRRRGNLHFLEFGSHEQPDIILNGGKDDATGGYVGGFEVPGVTTAEGGISFNGGLRINHRQRFVAYTLPLDNGGTLYLLPGQTIRFALDSIGRPVASTAPEMAVAIDLPVAQFSTPLRLQFSGGPDFIVRPGQNQSFSVLPTVSTSLIWNY